MDTDHRPHSRWYVPQQDASPRAGEGHMPDFAHSEHSRAMLDVLTGVDPELKHPHSGDEAARNHTSHRYTKL